MPLKERLAVSMIRLFSKLSLKAARRLGKTLATIFWLVGGKLKQTTLINLSIAYPKLTNLELNRLARASFTKLFCQAPEFAITWHRDLEWVKQHVTQVNGEELLNESPDNGTIMLVPHFGNWELLGQYLCTQREITAMYAPPKMKAFDDMIFSARERFGAKMVPASAKGVIGLTKTLKQGGTVFILPDQIPEDGGGVFAPFFGFPAYTMTLAVKLARKTNANVVVAAALPNDDGWHVEIHQVSDDVKQDDDIQAATAMNEAIERFIDLQPCCYQWEYKRYRKMPDTSIRVYDR